MDLEKEKALEAKIEIISTIKIESKEPTYVPTGSGRQYGQKFIVRLGKGSGHGDSPGRGYGHGKSQTYAKNPGSGNSYRSGRGLGHGCGNGCGNGEGCMYEIKRT